MISTGIGDVILLDECQPAVGPLTFVTVMLRDKWVQLEVSSGSDELENRKFWSPRGSLLSTILCSRVRC